MTNDCCAVMLPFISIAREDLGAKTDMADSRNRKSRKNPVVYTGQFHNMTYRQVIASISSMFIFLLMVIYLVISHIFIFKKNQDSQSSELTFLKII